MTKIFVLAFIAFTLVFAFITGGEAQESISPALSSPSITPAPAASPAIVPTTAGSPEASPVPAAIVSEEPSFIEKVLAFLKGAGGYVAGAVVVFEIFVRAFPTKNPLSVLVPVKHFVDTLALILTWLSNTVLLPLINAANKSQEKLEPKK